MKEIKYYLDQTELLDGAVYIRGWAAALNGELIRYEVREKQSQEPVSCKIKRLDRIDVARSVLHLSEAELVLPEKIAFGFELRFPVDVEAQVFELLLTAGTSSEQILLSTEKLRREQEKKYLSWKRILKMTSASVLAQDGKTLLKKGPAGLRKNLERYLTPDARYEKWLERHLAYVPGPLQEKPLFSIIVPAYRTPALYLQQMIDSVRQQTYENWELCIADGSGDGSLTAQLQAEAEKDSRIRFEVLSSNRGISGNTNAALAMAKGEIIALLDHDDVLAKTALWELAAAFEAGADVVYTDEDKVSMDLKRHFDPHFKSDYNLDLLRSNNYICHLFAVRREIVEQTGGFHPEFDGSQDYDFILRCTEAAKNIRHLPRVLYHWRSHPASTAADPESKDYCYEAGKRAVEAHLQRLGVEGTVTRRETPGYLKITYPVQGNPLVSILIPNKDQADTLRVCLDSIYAKTADVNFEIVIIENNSEQKETFTYYEQVKQEHENLQVVTWEGPFNYSAINNFGARYTKGDYLLLLNNDTEVISENWLSELVSICQRREVGVCGAKLLYPDGTIQHAGVIMKMTGTCSHAFLGMDSREWGRYGRAMCQQDFSAVTGACLIVKKELFEKLGGLSEEYEVAYNDVDFCLRVRREGYLVVWTPDALLYHYESKSRGYETTPEKKERFERERKRLKTDWPEYMDQGDPYYNPNLTLKAPDFSIAYDEVD